MTTSISVNALIKQVLQDQHHFEQRRHRRFCVVKGSRSSLQAFQQHLFSSFALKEIYFCSLHSVEDAADVQSEHKNVYPFSRKNIKNALGTECDMVIYDGSPGIDPELLGAVSGSLKAGGIFWLLLEASFPEKTGDLYLQPYLPYGWRPRQESYFLKRVGRIIEDDPCVSVFNLGSVESAIDHDVNTQVCAQYATAEKATAFNFTADQIVAGELIKKMAKGRSHRPLVLTADRGRGKTYLLGAIAKELQAMSAHKIMITAPFRHNVAPAFLAASREKYLNSDVDGHTHTNHYAFDGGGSLTYSPVDELLRTVDDCDLLLVDEASAIPVFLLEKLLKKFSRIVFSSTVHGYEGHGRGFAIAFPKILNKLTPGWKQIHMRLPVRWGEGDPLEHVINQLLLLNADMSSTNSPELNQVETPKETIKEIEPGEFLENEALLSQCFGLLVHAHYQTSPSDLMLLLDSPHIHLFVTLVDSEVIAVCMIAKEGAFASELDKQIHVGSRRPRGHLIPQTLTFHAGIEGASMLSCARIMRIATLPSFQNKGVASRLVNYVLNTHWVRSTDYLATSYSAAPDVVCFWAKNQFQLLRAGTSKDAASGVHSLVMGIPLSECANKLFTKLRLRNTYVLPDLFCTRYQGLPIELVSEIFMLCPQVALGELKEECLVDVAAFVHGHRPLETCIPLLARWVYSLDKSLVNALAKEQRYIIVAVLVLRLETFDVVGQLGLTGRKQVLSRLKLSLSSLARNADGLS